MSNLVLGASTLIAVWPVTSQLWSGLDALCLLTADCSSWPQYVSSSLAASPCWCPPPRRDVNIWAWWSDNAEKCSHLCPDTLNAAGLMVSWDAAPSWGRAEWQRRWWWRWWWWVVSWKQIKLRSSTSKQLHTQKQSQSVGFLLFMMTLVQLNWLICHLRWNKSMKQLFSELYIGSKKWPWNHFSDNNLAVKLHIRYFQKIK